MKIAVDFDGTIVEHAFPKVGKPNPGAIEYMKQWKEAGAKLILWTMRSDGQECGNVLSDAVEYCRENGVEFDVINEGINDREWTTSPKAHAHIYVDDAAYGCPLRDSTEVNRPMVNWDKVGQDVLNMLWGL
jgi:hypothetical protein